MQKQRLYSKAQTKIARRRVKYPAKLNIQLDVIRVSQESK